MNLRDFPEFKIDDFSGTRFGKIKQIEVLGYYMQPRVPISRGTRRFYVCKCYVCSQDPEMFGEGIFQLSDDRYKEGCVPCGCAKSFKANLDQTKLRVERCMEGSPYTVVSTHKEGYSTIATILCPIHGEWKARHLANIFRRGDGCPACRKEKLERGMKRRIATDIRSAKFMSSGSFADGTTFKPHAKGQRWDVKCGKCQQEYSSHASNLLSGNVGCCCSKDIRNGYINVVKDGEIVLGVKFGISSGLQRRLKQLDRKSVYTVENISSWEFSDLQSCRRAETECLRTLECGIISKADMPDGHTETTYCYNIEAIEAIYRKHGGVKI